jgi:SAM-dependent methyltransferase
MSSRVGSLEYVYTECRICDAQGEHKVFRLREMYFGTKEEFDYFQCCRCGCLQMAEIPSDLGRFYPSSYYSFNRTAEGVQKNRLTAYFQKQRCRTALFGRGYKINRLLSHVAKFPEELHTVGASIRRAGIKSFKASFLDVGCGSRSLWLNDLKQLGFRKLLGIDPFIRENIIADGIQILKKDIFEIAGRFSFITFHHSFEHIPAQLDTLKQIVRLLEPGGACLIRIPVVSSYSWTKYGVQWSSLDPPRHLFMHTARSIELLANKVGLDLGDIVYDSTEFEFVATEQYLRDIPLFADNSYFVNPEKSIFDHKQIEMFKKEAERINNNKCGGQAGFYFKTNPTAQTMIRSSE